MSAACVDLLRISPQGAIGASGHMGLTIQVDNPSTMPCQLSGFPAVRLLDATGGVMTAAADGGGFLTGTREPVQVVVIPPGDDASFVLEWADVSKAPCPGGVQLGVTLPRATSEATFPARSTDGVVVAPCETGMVVSPILARS